MIYCSLFTRIHILFRLGLPEYWYYAKTSLYLYVGSDYIADSTILVTLPAGTTEECFTIQIINDLKSEANETFGMQLIPIFDIGTIISNAVVVIHDDDG